MTTPAAVLAKAIDGARLPNGSWATDAQAILAALPDSIRQNVEAALVGEDSKTAPVIETTSPTPRLTCVGVGRRVSRRCWECQWGEPKP